MSKDYYKVLGVDKSSTPDQIKKAYRKMANKYHPDKNQGDKSAEAKFKEVSEAYETLSDPQKKKMYDQFGSAGPQGGGFGGFNAQDFAGQFNGAENFADLFETFFGGGFSRGQRGGAKRKSDAVSGEDLEKLIKISFEDSIFGVNKKIKYRKIIACELCEGSGVEPGHKLKTCETCSGQGVIQEVKRSLLGQVMSTRTCPTCNGQGQIPEKKCSKCNGHKRHAKDVEVTVKVPAGIYDGAAIRLRDKGNEGIKSSNGDLYIKVQVEPSNKFKREGLDIYSNLEVPYYLAILGGEINSETVYGAVDVKIPAGTQHGYEINFKGKGVPKIGSDAVGDHIFIIKIIIPKKVSSKEKKLLKEVQDQSRDKGKGFFS